MRASSRADSVAKRRSRIKSGSATSGDVVSGDDGDDLIRVADKCLAGEGDTVALKAHSGCGGGEIEPAAIAGDGAAGREVEPEIAERLVALLVAAEPVLGDVGVGLGIFAGLDEAGDVVEVFGDIEGAEIGGRFAGSEGVFVELELLTDGAAVNHGGEAAVADGEGVGPALGGLIIPECERVAGGGEGGGRERGGEGEKGDGDEAAGVSHGERGVR